MGRKYNKKYKKGKWNKSGKATLADYSKTAWKNLLEDTPRNREIWSKDTRRYDIIGIDTRRIGDKLNVWKYKYRSKKKLGKKIGRENKHYRRYWKGKR